MADRLMSILAGDEVAIAPATQAGAFSGEPAASVPATKAAARRRDALLRLCFVGPILGRNPGWVVSQGEVLGELLVTEGHTVRLTSHFPGRIRRMADTLASLLVWRGEIDLVIHLVFHGPGFVITDAASMLCRVLGLPQIFVLHGGGLPAFAAGHRRWVRGVLKRGALVIAPSGYQARAFDHLMEPAAAVHVIPNVLDIERYPYRQRAAVEPNLLWMRTFHWNYHPEMALDVLADLRSTHPAATLTMAGQEKGLGAAIRELASRRGLAGAVRFPGFLGPEDKVREFAAHDIYLNTNRVDNMPVSVLEAGAFGLPVVATAVGGIPYLLRDGETGLLVPDGDATAMSAAVCRLLDEPGLAGRLSANGRRLAESCAWEPVKAQWQTLFTEVLGHA